MLNHMLSLALNPLHDTIGVLAENKSIHFSATITAKDIPGDDDSRRAPVDIVVALDTSGSMSGEKLKLCKETLKLLLRELGPNDRFGLITFGTYANVQIPVRHVTIENKEAAITMIQKMSTSGSTNLSAGIGLAAQQMHSIKKPNEVRSLFLLTDGHANQGIVDNFDIVQLTKGCLNAEDCKSIPVHCFGYGSDHDGDLLRDISQACAGGSYYFIEDDSNVSSAFGDALGGVLSVVAQNVMMAIKAPVEGYENQGIKLIKVYHDNAKKLEDGSYEINIGDLYAEETRDIVFEVSLACKCIDASTSCVPHASVSMTYLDTIEKKLTVLDPITGTVDRPKESDFLSPINHDVNVQWLRIKTALIISETDDIAKQGDISRARTTIKEASEELKKVKFDHEQGDHPTKELHDQLMSDLSLIHSGLESGASYRAKGSYMMKSKQLAHKMQRCWEPDSGATNAYRNSKKKALSNSFSAHVSK